jgi:hypothetical protein
LIGGALALLSGNAVLSWTTPPAGLFWRRHRLVGLLVLAGAGVLLAALAGPAQASREQASPEQQDTPSSAGSSDDRRGETSQTDMRPSRDSASDDSGSAPVVTNPSVNAPSRSAPDDQVVAPAVADPARARDRAAAAQSPVPASEAEAEAEAEESPQRADASARAASATAPTICPDGTSTTRAPSASDSEGGTVKTEADARSTDDPAPSAHLTSPRTPVASVVFSTCPGCARPPPDSGCSTALTASRTTGAGGWAQSKPEERRAAMWSTREPITPRSPVRRLTPPVPLTPPASSAPTPGTSASGSGSGTGRSEHLDDLATLASSSAVRLVQGSARITSGAAGRVVHGVANPRGHPD